MPYYYTPAITIRNTTHTIYAYTYVMKIALSALPPPARTEKMKEKKCAFACAYFVRASVVVAAAAAIIIIGVCYMLCVARFCCSHNAHSNVRSVFIFARHR